jgi:two-component system, NtrC family, response regulator HydG
MTVHNGRSCTELVGSSPAIIQLQRVIRRFAAVDAPVLITGETGTGKELVANLLHQQSRRASGPFVAVNCAALPDSLFQSEVFGYERGAFTGAERRNIGRIEAAEGGTLLLDEIGDLPLDNQIALLRFLEEGSFERLGSCHTVRADVRIIAATHSDLETACRAGRFREDLFYRLGALRIHTPPLRERGDDVLSLARCFIDRFARQYEVEVRQLDERARRALLEHSWPGNVRELKNRVLQALVMGDGSTISDTDLGLTLGATPDESDFLHSREVPTLRSSRKHAEREAITRALQASGGNVQTAAAQLRVSRAQLYRLIKNHHLDHLSVNG